MVTPDQIAKLGVLAVEMYSRDRSHEDRGDSSLYSRHLAIDGVDRIIVSTIHRARAAYLVSDEDGQPPLTPVLLTPAIIAALEP